MTELGLRAAELKTKQQLADAQTAELMSKTKKLDIENELSNSQLDDLKELASYRNKLAIASEKDYMSRRKLAEFEAQVDASLRNVSPMLRPILRSYIMNRNDDYNYNKVKQDTLYNNWGWAEDPHSREKFEARRAYHNDIVNGVSKMIGAVTGSLKATK